MKGFVRKSLSVIFSLTIIMGISALYVYANQSCYQNFSGYSLSGDPVSDMVNVASAQVGKRAYNFGYTEGWCDNFISDCAIIAGQASVVPQAGDVNDFYNKLINAGGSIVSSPQAGDIIIYKYSNGSCFHTGLMVDGSNNIEGNVWLSGTTSNSNSYVYKQSYSVAAQYNGAASYVFIRPKYRKTHTCDYMASATISKAPTKTATGTRVRYCSCGKSTTETIPAIPYTTDIQEGIYTITSKCGNGLRVSTKSINGYFDVYICDGDYLDQYWLFRKNNDGTYTIENAYYNSRVLDVENIYMFNSGEICTSPYNGGDNQKFYIVPFGDGYYKFIAKHSYLCLDNVNASTTPGNGLLQVYDNGSDAQKWKPQLSNPSLSVSQSSVTLKFGENKTVNCTVDRETYEIVLEFGNSNPSVCSASWGSWNGMQNQLSISGKSGGISTLTVYLKDKETGIILGSKTINVTVTGNYTLAYNANGGSGAPASQTGSGNITLSTVKPTRSGYTFLGWSKSSTATSATYQPGAIYNLTSSTTLYAVWQKNETPSNPDNPSTNSPRINIRNYTASRTEAYRTTITFTAETANAPAGSSVNWYVNGEFIATAQSFTYKEARESFTIQAKLCNGTGQAVAESGIETVNIKTGFWAKIVAFFRNLFRKLPVIVQTIEEEY